MIRTILPGSTDDIVFDCFPDGVGSVVGAAAEGVAVDEVAVDGLAVEVTAVEGCSLEGTTDAGAVVDGVTEDMVGREGGKETRVDESGAGAGAEKVADEWPERTTTLKNTTVSTAPANTMPRNLGRM
ncbi:MAG TPA: hypothetical protein VMH27_16790 [Puia sp.]|nr:hypothetical protein [Puia sp.]